MKRHRTREGDLVEVLKVTEAPLSGNPCCHMIALRLKDNLVIYRRADGRHNDPRYTHLDIIEVNTDAAANHMHSRVENDLFTMILRLGRMSKTHAKIAVDLACVDFTGDRLDMEAYLKDTYGCEI